jgi:hypothetical protein
MLTQRQRDMVQAEVLVATPKEAIETSFRAGYDYSSGDCGDHGSVGAGILATGFLCPIFGAIHQAGYLHTDVGTTFRVFEILSNNFAGRCPGMRKTESVLKKWICHPPITRTCLTTMVERPRWYCPRGLSMENLCRGLGRKSCTGLSFRVDEKRG